MIFDQKYKIPVINIERSRINVFFLLTQVAR